MSRRLTVVTQKDRERIAKVNDLRIRGYTYERIAKRFRKNSAGALVSYLNLRALFIDGTWIPRDELTREVAQ